MDPARDAASSGAPLPGDEACRAYRRVLRALDAAAVPFLVGGAVALSIASGVRRPTRDLDLFLRQADYPRAAATLEAAGWRTALAHPHWLGKARDGPHVVDLIFSSGNGLAAVDDGWFGHATAAEVLGERVLLVPPEEMLWSKMFVMERERFDGADVIHLLRACGPTLDWARLIARVGTHWRVLLAHLVLFGYVYPSERDRVPAEVTERLLWRLHAETLAPAPEGDLCRGTLLSRAQYLQDVEREGYGDARMRPHGPMSAGDIAAWTEAIPDRSVPRPPQ